MENDFLGFILPLLYLAMTLLISIKGVTYSNGTNFPYYFLNYREYGWFNLHGYARRGLVDSDCRGNGVCRDVSAIGI